jgi:hypothetical protein
MPHTPILRRVGWISAAGAGAAALFGAAHAGTTWYRYGRVIGPRRPDPLLDSFMPTFDVRERHEIRVAAPVADTYAAALEMDILRSRIARGIFRGRELLMGGRHADDDPAAALLARTIALGWGVLAEEPGREVVVGAMTRPWETAPRFEALAPDAFAAFAEPGYVKIAWTLGAEPVGPAASIASTETRVATTDAAARRRFRAYWALVSPGILLIRRQGLRLVRSDAERRYREAVARLPS